MVILYWCLIPTGTWEELVLEAAFASGVDAVEISAHAIEFQDLENALFRIYRYWLQGTNGLDMA